MTINNKILYKMYKALEKNSSTGLYIEGYNGGITIYATDGYVIFKKTITGDNNAEFVLFCYNWSLKDGDTDIKFIEKASDQKIAVFKQIKEYFLIPWSISFSVNTREFKKAVKCVDTINNCGIHHNIVISANEGKINISSWNTEDESGIWQLDGEYNITGAVSINKKYLDSIKSGTTMDISYNLIKGNVVININNEAVIISQKINPVEFLDVLGYEYTIPVSVQDTVQDTEKNMVHDTVKDAVKDTVQVTVTNKKRKMIPQKPEKYKVWKYNRLGTKQTMVLNW